MKHAVRQAVLELSLGEQSRAAMDAYRQFFERRVQPSLASTLDDLARPDRDQHLERLEIDLGTIDFDSRQSDWHDKIRIALSRALTHGVDAVNYPVTDEVDAIHGKTQAQVSLLDLILYFLRFGILPWYESRPFRQLEQEFRTAPELATQSVTSAELLDIEKILKAPDSRIRLLKALRPATRSWIIATYIEAQLRVFVPIVAPTWDAKKLADQLAQSVLHKPLPERTLSRLASDVWWTRSKQHILDMENPAADEIESVLENALAEPSLPDVAVELTDERRHIDSEGVEAESTDNAFFVQNAGVVLVAVFLLDLFSRLKLLDSNKQFANTAANERGVHLVHYLATAEINPHESELALAKMLCGLDVQHGLGLDVCLSGEEKTECENVLESAIRHWKSVGNTSAKAIRETFLQREGKLEHLESAWLLTVEQRGVDVLVSSLPWALGTIRLPWLSTPLQVDWA